MPTMIIGLGKPKMDEEEKSSPSLGDMGRKKAAKDVMRSIQAGDASALDKALAAHYAACEGGDDMEEDSEEDSEDTEDKPESKYRFGK